jgi:hypothetical protein
MTIPFRVRPEILAVFLMLAAVGCKPKIGDDCNVSSDCSVTGDRLCDTTQPGGYCTIFNCEPGSCPDEAICVAFVNAPSALPACSDKQGGQRLQRAFCLRRCDANDDCRGDYVCADMGRPNPWGAVVIENGSTNGKVCTVRFRGDTVKEDSGLSSNVCTGSWTGDGGGISIDSGSDGTTSDGASDSESSVDDGASDAGESDAEFDALFD